MGDTPQPSNALAAGKPEPLNFDSSTVAQEWVDWKEAASVDDLPGTNQVGYSYGA